MEYRIKLVRPDGEVTREMIWSHLATKLYRYVNEGMQGLVDYLICELEGKLCLGTMITDSLHQRMLTQKERLGKVFNIVGSTEILSPGTIDKALVVLLNLDGSHQLSKMIREIILTDFKGRVEVKEEFKWRDTIPTRPAYYISRNISFRTRLTPEFLKEETNDVFLVSGIEWNELSGLVKPKTTDISSSQTRNITADFILLEVEDHFDRIRNCAMKARKQVHWVKKDGDEFHWVKSSGNVGLLQKYIHPKQERVTEKEFAEKLEAAADKSPVCIADNPGMGKTILLANLANQLKCRSPGKHVFFFVLREIIPQLEKVAESDLLLSLILSCVETSRADEQALVRRKLAEEIKAYQFELLFDGFDEVLLTQLDTCRKLFQSLLQQPNCRIHVTTRLHMLEELELALGVLGNNILPFTVEEQKNFLRKCWIEEYKAQDTDSLSDFAIECLGRVKAEMTDSECDIAGIPLQCYMIADIFSDEAVDSSKGKLKYGVSIQVESIFDLYQKLFEKKFSRIEALFKPMDEVKLQKLKDFHALAAFQLVFPDFLEIIDLESTVKLTEEEINSVYSAGLIEPNLGSDTPRFLHRTFAECLIAQHLVKMLLLEDSNHCSNRNPRIISFFLRNILLALQETFYVIHFYNDGGSLTRMKTSDLSIAIPSYNFQYRTINYFVNCYLQNSVNLVRYEQLAGEAQFIPHQDILLPCATNGFHHTLEFIFSIMRFFHIPPGKPDHLYFIATELNCDLEMMMKITKFSGNVSSVAATIGGRRTQQVTPLHLAVRKGSLALSSYLLNLYEGNIPQGLLHCCMAGSSWNSKGVVNAKVEIVKLLVRENRACLDELWFGVPAILSYSCNYRLIETLIKLGADVNLIDEENESVLHKIPLHEITLSTFTEFCSLLEYRGFGRWGEAGGYFVKTPLHGVARLFDVDRPTLSFFKERRADFNARDKDGNTIIHVAIEGGRGAECIKLLIEFGCDDVWDINEEGKNVIHVAAEAGNYEVLRYLTELDDYEDYINDKDLVCVGHAPLFYAERSDVAQLLLEKGAEKETRVCTDCY